MGQENSRLINYNGQIDNGQKSCFNLKINPFLKSYTISNFQQEIYNIETARNVKIYLEEDSALSNSEVIFIDAEDKTNNKAKKTKRKSPQKEQKVSNKKTLKKEKETKKTEKIKAKTKIQKPSLKEIKNKKTGWWQK